MDLLIGLFCLFIFVRFVAVLAISFLLRCVSVLQWQLEATSGARNYALWGWQHAAEELGACPLFTIDRQKNKGLHF